MNSSHRLHALDAARGFALLLGIVLHATMSFFTIIPAPYFKKYGKNPAIKAFVDGVTAAAIGAIAGAVCVLGMRQFTDMTSVAFAVITVLILLKFKKIQEPIIILIAAIVGLLIKAAL